MCSMCDVASGVWQFRTNTKTTFGFPNTHKHTVCLSLCVCLCVPGKVFQWKIDVDAFIDNVFDVIHRQRSPRTPKPKPVWRFLHDYIIIYHLLPLMPQHFCLTHAIFQWEIREIHSAMWVNIDSKQTFCVCVSVCASVCVCVCPDIACMCVRVCLCVCVLRGLAHALIMKCNTRQ